MFDRRSKFIEHADIPLSKRIKYVDDEDTTLELHENICIVDSGDGTVTITLPDVSEAAGMAFDVTASTGNTNTVTVKDANGNDVTSSSTEDGFMTVISTGMNWRTLANA